jgi:hypothetical protein
VDEEREVRVTLDGVLVLLGWIPSAAFLYMHARTPWRTRPAGIAVFVLALVVFLAMTLALVRRTFELVLPDWLVALSYGFILIALWWMVITIAHYRYGVVETRQDSGVRTRSTDVEENAG